MFEKIIGLSPLLILWQRMTFDRRWIAGKRYIPQQKSPRKGTSVECPLGDGKSVGVAERFPWPVGWSQIGYPKKRVFRQIRSLNGNFSGIWNDVPRDTTWARVRGKFGGNRSKESDRSAWCVVHVTKQRLCDPFFRALSESSKPIARFRWKRARLSIFRPQPHLPSFNQIHPSFRDLLAKTTFQIVTIICVNDNLVC